MTIYIDIIFLENIFMNLIILFATETILKKEIKIFRTFAASGIGATYAVLMYIYNMQVYSNFILKIALSCVMVEIAMNPRTIKAFFKCITIFYLTSFTFGGVAISLIYFVNPKKIVFNNGKLTGLYPIKMILIGGVLGFIIMHIAFKNIKNKFTKEDMLCNLKIILNGKSTSLTAIVDTGNFLRDPISKNPVIVVNKDSLKTLLPTSLLDNVKEIISGKNIKIDKYAERIRLIPFSSLGKENGMLLGVKADDIIIDYHDNKLSVKNAIIGIYAGSLSKNNKYQALIGLEAVESKGEQEYEYFENIEI